MALKEDFKFLNSELWLKYTQEKYLPLEDIKYRLEPLGFSSRDWPQIQKRIQILRKMGAIPFFVNSIDKKFWYFPADVINQKVQKIETLGRRLHSQIESSHSFKREFLINSTIEEAIVSAIYEGANSTRAEAKILIESKQEAKNKDEQMLLNNYKAMQWIQEHSELPISNELILKIHEIVTKDTMEGKNISFSGRFRNDVVYVGPHEGISHVKIEETLKEVVRLVTNHPRALHGLIRGILLHYFIAYIHPFFDGNGRTARTLFYLQTAKSELKFIELLSISADLKTRGKKYEKSFEAVKEHDLDMTFFIDFCLDSLLKALQKVEEKVNYLVDIGFLKEEKRLSLNQVALLQKMALNKYREIDIEGYAQSIGKSREVARNELKFLAHEKLLREETKGKKFVYRIESSYLKSLIQNYQKLKRG